MNENENTNTTTTEATETTENVGAEQEQERTYTFAEVQKMLQVEGDRRTSMALKKQAKEYEKKLSLSQLDSASREKAEKDIRIAELEEKLANYEIEKNKSELKTVLSARGLSAEFCDLVHITDDIEESQARIDTLDKLFKAAVAAEVKKRLASANPQMGNDGTGAIDWQRMSLAEKQQLFNTNPELYRKLSGK